MQCRGVSSWQGGPLELTRPGREGGSLGLPPSLWWPSGALRKAGHLAQAGQEGARFQPARPSRPQSGGQSSQPRSLVTPTAAAARPAWKGPSLLPDLPLAYLYRKSRVRIPKLGGEEQPGAGGRGRCRIPEALTSPHTPQRGGAGALGSLWEGPAFTEPRRAPHSLGPGFCSWAWGQLAGELRQHLLSTYCVPGSSVTPAAGQ